MNAEARLTFDGTDLNITGSLNLSGSQKITYENAATNHIAGLKIYDSEHETSNTGGIISFSSNRNTTTNEIERATIGGFAESGAAGSEDGYFKVSTMNSSGTLVEALRLASTQQLKLNGYGSGTYTGTAAKTLQVDSSGNVIEGPS